MQKNRHIYLYDTYYLQEMWYYTVFYFMSLSDLTDYTNTSGSLTYIPGSSNNCVVVPVEDDGLVEMAENFTMTFTSNIPGVVSSSTTITILDNDQIGKHVFSYIQ